MEDTSAAEMTLFETTILELLKQRPGELVTNDEIRAALYPPSTDDPRNPPKSNTIQVFVARLRKKVAPLTIRSVRHKGYRLEGTEFQAPAAEGAQT
jgi:DNA-binding response OmpR family regulator